MKSVMENTTSTEAAQAWSAELRPGLQGLEVDPTIFRPATYIERSISNLARALAIGTSLLVALTITPALCLLLLPGAPERRAEPSQFVKNADANPLRPLVRAKTALHKRRR